LCAPLQTLQESGLCAPLQTLQGTANITPLQFQDIRFRVSSILVVVYSLKPLSLRG
jgi:hypothetical protein